MKHILSAFVIAIGFTQGVSAETIQLEGRPMSFDLGYGVKINQGSSLMRQAVIVQDELLPVRLTEFSVQTTVVERDWRYKVSYQLVLDVDVVAVEVRFIPFDIWGEKKTSLSTTEIQDLPPRMISKSASWRLSETDAVQHFTMIGYVAQVKLASGEILRANPDQVVEVAQQFSGGFLATDLAPD